VSDLVWVDVGHILRLSREFRASASELRTRIQRFHEQTANTNGAYGETPNAQEAEREYQETLRQTTGQLEKMHSELVEIADTLEEQARIYRDTEAKAEGAAAELNAEI
jgi:uncharacterized protein YukE